MIENLYQRTFKLANALKLKQIAIPIFKIAEKDSPKYKVSFKLKTSKQPNFIPVCRF